MTEIELEYVEDFANAVILLDLKPIFVEKRSMYDLLFALHEDKIYTCQVPNTSNWQNNLVGHVVLNAVFPKKNK